MAFVRVTPYYVEGNPQPVKLTFNELINKKKEHPKKEVENLESYTDEDEQI